MVLHDSNIEYIGNTLSILCATFYGKFNLKRYTIAKLGTKSS